ncbi:MAG: Ku protein [Candidatus Obscuribacterales bacterium]|nr:MAG: hypothetical protein EKK48_16740 [Candidatus Melainabacteria bacterium]
MSRSVWTGMLSFGMVNIPSYLVASDDTTEEIERHAPNFDEIRERNKTKRDFKIHQFTQQQHFFKDLNELKSLAIPPKHVMQIHGFLPTAEMDPACYDKSFMFLPEIAGSEPLVLLIDALSEKECIAIGTIYLHNKPAMLAVQPRRGFLYAHTLLYPDQLDQQGKPQYLNRTLFEALELFESTAKKCAEDEHEHTHSTTV